MLKPPYAGLNLNSDVANYGITSNLIDRFTFLSSSNTCTFTNLKCGIKCLGDFSPSRFVANNHHFVDNDTCVYLENSANVRMDGNEMSYNSIGLAIKNPSENAQISIGTGGQNTFTCNNPSNLCYSGIYLNNIHNSERVLYYPMSLMVITYWE